MNDTRQKWIQAGAMLAKDRTAKVLCPKCATGMLAVTDYPHPGDSGLVDRYLDCPSCGAREVLVRLPLESPQADR